MHTHAYDVSVQFGAEIWATAKTEKKTKNVRAATFRIRQWASGWKKLGKAAKALKGIILYGLKDRFEAPCKL